MIETLDHSSDRTLGFSVSGTVTKEDYDTLVPAVAAAVDAHGSVALLLDLTGFHWEKVSAWARDLRFGKEYHDKIDKMAIVGDKKWEQYLAKLAQPFYAAEVRYFDDENDGWAWLED